MKLGDDTEDKLSNDDWRVRYIWPDADEGWSGPLSGYPPDHPIRGGKPIPLHLIARRYWDDPRVTSFQAKGLITSSLSQELAEAVELTGHVTELNPDVTEFPEDVTEFIVPRHKVSDPGKRGPKKSALSMTPAERKRLSRQRKKGKPA